MSPSLTDAARELGGPTWLRERRAEAVAAVGAMAKPTTDEELWRYSRIDDLDLSAYRLPDGPGDRGVSSHVPDVLGALVDRAATVVVRNGRVVDVEVDDALAAKGLLVGPALDGDDGALGQALSAEGPTPSATDYFTLLNDAALLEPVVVRIPDGVDLQVPVVVVHVTEGDRVAAFPRLVVHAGRDSSANVVEVQVSAGRDGLVVPVTEVVADRAARVGIVNVQQLDLSTWQVGLQASRVEADATFRSTSVGFGGGYARLRTDCRMVGRGATGELDAIYFGEGDQTLDFRTFQEHIAPECTSNLLFKGAGGGRSRSVYTGLIRVAKEARGTNAFQTNRNVKLSDQAWAESIPNLVIENNDVRCSHASAVGPIDEEQCFYLESRGLPTDVAERLIVGGFFGEVLAKLPVPALAPVLARTIGNKFDRRSS
ncbi:MAG TPA: Fe-S cluster assembly protein SufD [Acidimicrobiales bacterium]